MNKEMANMEPWKKKANNRLCSVEASGWQVTSTLFTKGEGFLQVIPSVWV